MNSLNYFGQNFLLKMHHRKHVESPRNKAASNRFKLRNDKDKDSSSKKSNGGIATKLNWTAVKNPGSPAQIPTELAISSYVTTPVYKFKYKGGDDNQGSNYHNRYLYDFDALTLHHPKTEQPTVTASTTPFHLHPIPISEREFLKELSRPSRKKDLVNNTDYDDGDNDDDDDDIQNGTDFGQGQGPPSSTSVRQMLLNAGFLPTHSTEMMKFYQDLADEQHRGLVLSHTSASDTSINEQREAAEAFAGPLKNSKDQGSKKSLQTATTLAANAEFPNSKSRYTKTDAKQKSLVQVFRKNGEDPQDEPDPRSFIASKIKVSPVRQERIIEAHLIQQKGLRGRKLKASEYDEQKRALMDAALNAYENEHQKPTDDLLDDLAAGKADPIFYHDIRQDDLENSGELNLTHFGLTDHEFKRHVTSTVKTLLSLGGMSTTVAHENYGSLFSTNHSHSLRPLDKFKGSIMASVMKEIEQEGPYYFQQQMDSVPGLPGNKEITSHPTATGMATRRREIVKQTLANYNFLKQQRLNSIQIPRKLKLISPSPVKQLQGNVASSWRN